MSTWYRNIIFSTLSESETMNCLVLHPVEVSLKFSAISESIALLSVYFNVTPLFVITVVGVCKF